MEVMAILSQTGAKHAKRQKAFGRKYWISTAVVIYCFSNSKRAVPAG